MQTKLIFIRHSESVKNVLNINDWTDDKKFPLTNKWLEQALKLKDFLNLEKVDYIYSSPFFRAIETIKPFALENNLEIIIDTRLKEVHHWKFEWDWNNKDYSKDKLLFKEYKNYKIWINGESQNEILFRMNDILQEIIKNHTWKTIAIVSHWYPLSIILEHIDKTEHWSSQTKPQNAIPNVRMVL